MDANQLEITQAGFGDLEALLDLYQHLAPGDDRPTNETARAILDRFISYSGSAIFLGRIGSTLAASCSLVVVPNLTKGGTPYGLIENVVTHTDYRKRGIGKTMLLTASDAAWMAGCYKVMLLTGSKRPETLDFYLGAGFEQSKTGFQKRRLPARSDA